MSKMNPVVHFEMGYYDRDRMANFYEKTFGWRTIKYGPDMGNYVIAHTTPTDGNGMTKDPGAINGGFFQKTDNPLSHQTSVVISVDDIKAAMDAVVKAGGKIAGSMTEDGQQSIEPQDIPDVGLWISAIDTEGNRFSILQPNK